jgi:hypothetical protein
MVKIQTLTTTALCALITLGAIGFITGNSLLEVIAPPLVLGSTLLVGVVLNACGRLTFPESSEGKR